MVNGAAGTLRADGLTHRFGKRLALTEVSTCYLLIDLGWFLP
jgi:hypothetical protein